MSLRELLYPQEKENTASYDLTEEEKQAALKAAQEQKERLLKYEEDQLRRREWERVLSGKWTAHDMDLWVTYKANRDGLDLVVDDHNRDVLQALCLYFTNSPSFEKIEEGFSLQKGILIRGPVGTGKTTLLGLFRSNPKRSFKLVSCREVADQFKSSGEVVLHQWSDPLSVPNSSSTFYQTSIGACFDDLGTEGAKRHYGDHVNVMSDVLLNRYDRKSTPFEYTHLTTNLTADEIGELYGDRVRSRMREMFNTLTLLGGDRRK